MTETISSPAPVSGATAKEPWYKREFYLARPVKLEELMNFSRQIASFLGAGIPILDALTVIAEDNASKPMSAVLLDLRQQLRNGSDFGDALARHTRVFPGYYISMVRAAEVTGRLDEIMEQLANYISRDVAARRKIKSALTYPVVIVGMAIVAVFVLALWVLPKFKSLFEDLDAKLPLITRILLSFTDFVGAHALLLLVALVTLAALVGVLLGGKRGKRRRDTLVLKLPAAGGLVRFVLVERFCRVLGALVNAGVALPDALDIASASTNNFVFQTKLHTVRDAVIRGEGFSRPVAASGLFPPAARQMIRVGETTGTLDRQLITTADFYERELEYRLKRFTDLFEPAVIIVVGVVVGFIALALVSAMYGVFDQVQV